MQVLLYKNIYVQCFPYEMQRSARALNKSQIVTIMQCGPCVQKCIWKKSFWLLPYRLQVHLIAFPPPGETSPLCFSSNINIVLTQLSFRPLLKCIFNHISQLNVLACPSGAIFRLNFFRKPICTIDNAMLITRSHITLFKNITS